MSTPPGEFPNAEMQPANFSHQLLAIVPTDGKPSPDQEERFLAEINGLLLKGGLPEIAPHETKVDVVAHYRKADMLYKWMLGDRSIHAEVDGIPGVDYSTKEGAGEALPRHILGRIQESIRNIGGARREIKSMGFGHGGNELIWAAELGATIDGLDITPSHVEQSRKNLSEINPELADKVKFELGSMLDYDKLVSGFRKSFESGLQPNEIVLAVVESGVHLDAITAIKHLVLQVRAFEEVYGIGARPGQIVLTDTEVDAEKYKGDRGGYERAEEVIIKSFDSFPKPSAIYRVLEELGYNVEIHNYQKIDMFAKAFGRLAGGNLLQRGIRRVVSPLAKMAGIDLKEVSQIYSNMNYYLVNAVDRRYGYQPDEEQGR